MNNPYLRRINVTKNWSIIGKDFSLTNLLKNKHASQNISIRKKCCVKINHFRIFRHVQKCYRLKQHQDNTPLHSMEFSSGLCGRRQSLKETLSLGRRWESVFLLSDMNSVWREWCLPQTQGHSSQGKGLTAGKGSVKYRNVFIELNFNYFHSNIVSVHFG